MENLYSFELKQIEKSIDNLSMVAQDELAIIRSVDQNVIDNVPSSMDVWDVCFSVAVGYLALTITTEEQLSIYLEDIHKASSGASGEYDTLQSQLGKLLFHKGDHIDMIERPFKNRRGTNAYGAFHRLLWGHDILSIHKDNPFVLMVNQKGLAGILQAFQHLLADTMSKQGLPLPGSSYLDFEKENGSISNYLIKIAEDLSETSVGNKRNGQSIYSHMFTIRAGDFAGNVTIEAISTAYFKTREIKNDLRITQFKLISYIIAFMGHAIIGSGRQDGIPYVNISEAIEMIKNFNRLYVQSWKETKIAIKKSENAIIESEYVLSQVDEAEKLIKEYDSFEGYVDEIKRSQDSVNSLIGFMNRKG